MDPAERYLDEPGAAGLFTRLSRVGLLLDAFQHAVLDAHGLRFVDYSVMRVLELAGGQRMTPGELADIVLRSSGGMTQILDRLERAGLIEREQAEDDRRKVSVGLTAAGHQLAGEARTRYATERDRLLSGLSDAEVTRIDRAVRRLLDLLSRG